MAVLPTAASFRQSSVKPFVFPPTTETREETYVERNTEVLLFFVSWTLVQIAILLVFNP